MVMVCYGVVAISIIIITIITINFIYTALLQTENISNKKKDETIK